MAKASKLLYLSSVGVGYVAYFAGTLVDVLVPGWEGDAEMPWGYILLVLACVALILYGAVMYCVLLYKMWAAIQGPTSRTTPGRAVGFMFIPIFNIYWLFQAHYGWAKDYNALRDQRVLSARRAPEGMTLAMCVLGLLMWVPIVGPVLDGMQLVLSIVFLNAGCNAINALASSPLPTEQASPQVPRTQSEVR